MATYDLGHARGVIEIDTSDLTRASAAFTSVGKGLLGIGTAAAAGVGLAIKTAADFEKTVSAIGAVMGADPMQLQAIRENAMQLGKDTVFSAREVASGMEELAKAGLTVEEITGGASEGMVALAAAAGNMKLDEAAVIAVNAMKTFGLSAGELDHVADSMAGAANKSTLEVQDLAVSLRYVGGTAKAMGANIDEVNTTLAILGDRGIRGSTAGTSLRGVLLSLSPSSKKAAAMMKELGLITEDGSNKFFTASGEMKSMRDVMQILGDATKDLTEQQKTHAFNVIFQRRAMASALFMAEAGAKGFDEYAKAISDVSATEVAAAKLDNLAGDIEKLKSNIETFLIEGGTPFQEQLREWVQGLTNLVKAFGELSPNTQRNIFKLVAWIAVVFSAMGATSLFIGQIIKFIEILMKLAAAAQWAAAKIGLLTLIEKAKSGFETLAIKGLYLIDTLKKMGLAVKAFTMSLLTNPVFLIIAAIVALGAAVYLLYKKWEPFQKFVDQAWQDFQVGWDIILGFARDLTGTVIGALGKFVDAMAKMANAAGEFIGGVIEWFKLMPGRIVNFITLIPGRVVGALNAMWDAIYESVSNGIAVTVDFFAGLPEKVMYWLMFLVGRALRLIGMFMMSQYQQIKQGLGMTIDFFQALPGRVISFFDQLWDGIWAWGEKVVKFFQELPGKIVALVDSWWDSMYASFMVGKDVLIAATLDWFNDTLQFFKDLPGNVVAFIDQTWDWIYASFLNGIHIVVEATKKWFNDTVQFFKDLPGNVIGALDSLWDRMWQTMRGIGYRAYEGIKEGLDKTLTFFKEFPGKVISYLANMGTELWNKMKSIGSSMWEGFKKGLFGSPKTKIEYALIDLLAAARSINAQMGVEMSKLQSMTIGKMGDAAITLGGGSLGSVAASPGAVSNTYEGDSISITEAASKSAGEISKAIMFEKRVRVRSNR